MVEQDLSHCVSVRHYCQGIGDCHLLGFPRSGGGRFWMLIDCGVHVAVSGGSDKIRAIVEDIKKQTGGRLDVIVLTHEHWDHASGFYAANEMFRSFEVGEVWLGWTENPQDAQARQLDKFKGDAITALQMASNRLRLMSAGTAGMSSLRAELDSVLDFSPGVAGQRVREARNNVVALAPGRVRYLEPSPEDPRTLPGVDNIRVYVLGPPRDRSLLGITDRDGELYQFGSSGGGLWGLDGASDGYDSTAPFDTTQGVSLSQLGSDLETVPNRNKAWLKRFHKLYFGTEDDWRRIDNDWLASSSTLAMRLDNLTNNTSLALAFEFVDSGRILLFPGDAQLGSWISWKDLKWHVNQREVTGADLLSRTIHLKIAHHGSENATPRQTGLELMRNPDLTAFIPVSEGDARKVHWNRMPFDKMMAELTQKTSGRVIRADDPWVAKGVSTPIFPSGSVRSLKVGAGLWVECHLR